MNVAMTGRGSRGVLQHSAALVSVARRLSQQPGEHQARAGLHRGGDAALPQGSGGLPGVRRCTQQPRFCVAAARYGNIQQISQSLLFQTLNKPKKNAFIKPVRSSLIFTLKR